MQRDHRGPESISVVMSPYNDAAEFQAANKSGRIGMPMVADAVSVHLAVRQTFFHSRGLQLHKMLPYAKFRV